MIKAGDLVKTKEDFGPDLKAGELHTVFMNREVRETSERREYFIMGHSGTKVVFMTEYIHNGEMRSQKFLDESESLTAFNKDVILPVGGMNGILKKV